MKAYLNPTDEYKTNINMLSRLCDDDPFVDIYGWEGEYAISPRGEVYSYRTHNLMKPIRSSTGYLVVNLKRSTYYEQRFIHRLVAEAFIPNPYEDRRTIINHLDENPFNNWATNLEWCTVDHNNRYGSWRPRVSLEKSTPIICVDGIGRAVEYYGINEASRETHTVEANIFKVLNGERRQAGGYQWYRPEDYINMMREAEGYLTDEEREMSRQALLEDHGRH